MARVTWESAAQLRLFSAQASRRVAIYLRAWMKPLFGAWYFESAEGTQSKYGFTGDSAASAELANKLTAVQQDHRELVTGRSLGS